jgi:hypothetical protein
MDMLRYFREPIFVWTKLPDEQSTVILTYIASAILPVVALAMTAMITSFLNNDEKTEDNRIPETIEKTDDAPEKSPEEPEMINDTDKVSTDDDVPEQMVTDTAPVPINDTSDELKKSHLVSL